ncbi:serine/threonine protein kinase [Gigaspora margarita]|uniref:Serine/threonine protein kinase n=1 Tax=Gigaspora margarita TaxID=4874 RepID=A0A8H4AVU1_GIGMA|nr:serine/threonine protein kinase [Gigaspora margarita]
MGNANGTYSVGYCYDNGIGVEKDDHNAFIYYQKSAEIGHFEGTFMTGFCYRNGKGIKRDIQKANYWFKKYYEFIIDNEIINDDNDVKKMLDNNKYQLSWIPYKNLKSIEEVGNGGFAKIIKQDLNQK